MDGQPNNQGFKPSMYPLMYWALAYGAVSGVALFVMFLLSRFITVIWFPVFLAGLVWGGYRNYQRQKTDWQKNTGTSQAPQTPINEFKQAVADVVDASREMISQQETPAQPEVLAEEQLEPELDLEQEVPAGTSVTVEEEQEITPEELPPSAPQSPIS